MTGYQSAAFRYDCSKRGCHLKTLPDWGDLFDCFPRGIMPTDIDGMVEINGHFVFLEEKGCGAGPSQGQRVALRRLACLDTKVAVIYFRPHTTHGFEIMKLSQRHQTGWEPYTRDQFKTLLKAWADWADNQTHPLATEKTQ